MEKFLLIAAGIIYGLTALLLMGAVLLQESKGGGLAALGGTRAESAFGASNPLRRLTVGLSVIFFLLASVLAIALAPPKSVAEQEPAAASTKGEEEGEAGDEEQGGKGTGGVSVEVPIKGGGKDDGKAGGGEEKPGPEKDTEKDAKKSGGVGKGDAKKPADD